MKINKDQFKLRHAEFVRGENKCSKNYNNYRRIGSFTGCSMQKIRYLTYGREPANDGEHGHAAVLELSLSEELHVEVVGEADGVELSVALNVILDHLGWTIKTRRL